MPSLLDFFDEYDRKYGDVGAKDFHLLKKLYDGSTERKDYNEMEFQLRAIMRACDAFRPKSLQVSIEEKYLLPQDTEFNPTLSAPNISMTDVLKRSFSIWYRPMMYVPLEASAKAVSPDFIFIRGATESLYHLDERFVRSLSEFEFLNDAMLHELSMRLLSRLNPVAYVFQIRKKFKVQDINDAKLMQMGFRPARTVLISESEFQNDVKMALPIGAVAVENVDINSSKVTDAVRQII